MGTKRHYVDLMLPASGKGSLGQRSGAPTVVIAQMPAEIEDLFGRELELARQTYAQATLRVKVWGDPARPITAKHYLQFSARKMHIGHVKNLDQLGIAYELLCGESP